MHKRKQKILDRIASLRKQGEDLLALADKDNRDLSADEQTAFDKNIAEIGKRSDGDQKATGLCADLEREESLSAIEKYQTAVVENPASAPVSANLNADGSKKIHITGVRTKPKHFKSAEDAYLCGRFLRGALSHNSEDIQWCKEHGVNFLAASAGTAQSSTSNATGGILIPDVLSQAIIDLKEQYGVFRANCSVMPMTSDTLTIPRRLTGLTTYYVAESTDATASKLTFDGVTLTARKLVAAAIYPMELADDAVINLADKLAQELAYAFSKGEDDAGFIGDGTSTYGGIQGVMTAVGSASVVDAASTHTGFETLTRSDFLACIGKLPKYALPRAKWYVSNAGYAASMANLMYAAGGNNVGDLGSGTGPSFLGYPVVISQSLNNTLGADTSVKKVIFGDLTLSSTLGDRMGFAVTSDKSLYFLADQIVIKGTQRYDIVNHDCGTSTTAGPVVVLKTAAS